MGYTSPWTVAVCERSTESITAGETGALPLLELLLDDELPPSGQLQPVFVAVVAIEANASGARARQGSKKRARRVIAVS
jgi:hypothetical protein